MNRIIKLQEIALLIYHPKTLFPCNRTRLPTANHPLLHSVAFASRGNNPKLANRCMTNSASAKPRVRAPAGPSGHCSTSPMQDVAPSHILPQQKQNYGRVCTNESTVMILTFFW